MKKRQLDGILLSICMTCEEQLDVNTATGLEIKAPKQRQLNNLHSPVLHLRPEKNKLSFLQQCRIFIILPCKLDNNICIVDVTPC